MTVRSRAPLTVCLLARDEAEDLSRCLDAIDWADEIVVVVDDRSDDATEALARSRAQHVERRAYAGDVAQKRYCAGLAKHDWVLILDPDEVVTPALAASIQEALTSHDAQSEAGSLAPEAPIFDAYRLNRVTWHLGQWIRHGDYYPDWKVRLFRKSRTKFVGADPHGRIEVEGKGAVGILNGELEHYSYRDLSDQVQRIQFFSDQAAAAMASRGHPVRWSDIVLRPPARFLRSYFLKRGFLDGRAGFVIAAASAFYVFLKYAKYWEMKAGLVEGAPRE